MDADAHKLVALKEELRKDLEALERVERLIASKNGALLRPDDRQFALPMNVQVDDRNTLTDETDEDLGPRTSLRGKIAEIINSDPQVRWTTPKMLIHLQSIDFPLHAKKPIYSIGQSMQKLAEKGVIRIVRRGVGNQPNIYKGKGLGQEQPQGEQSSDGGTLEPEM
ncbi:MAG: hypothetical protein JO099_16210 [Acidobacteriia bacterium]|nr:hypothetical protein [Terriglobia bacterium]